MDTKPNNPDNTTIDQDSTTERRNRTNSEPERDVPGLPTDDDETQRLLDPVKTKTDRAA